MRVVVVTPPDPVLSLEEAKHHLRVDGDDDDALITALVAAATGHIDGPMGWLGRAIGVQTLTAWFDWFGYDQIRLPCAPVIEVQSVAYRSSAGVDVTLDPDSYDMRGDRLAPAHGFKWPVPARCGGSDETVAVTYVAGYDIVPAPIRAAILLMVGDLYAFRESATDGIVSKVPMAPTVDALLAPYRVWG